MRFPADAAHEMCIRDRRCDLLVFTGGLGPTADDLTKETVAACFGDTLTFDPEEWQKIVYFLTRTGRETTPNNRKQAMVPVHGHKVVNHHGTAQMCIRDRLADLRYRSARGAVLCL